MFCITWLSALSHLVSSPLYLPRSRFNAGPPSAIIGPAWSQHWVNVLHYLPPSLHLSTCVGFLARHRANGGRRHKVCSTENTICVCRRLYLFFILCIGRGQLLHCFAKPKAVSAYLQSKQILPFGFARQCTSIVRKEYLLQVQHSSSNLIIAVLITGIRHYVIFNTARGGLIFHILENTKPYDCSYYEKLRIDNGIMLVNLPFISTMELAGTAISHNMMRIPFSALIRCSFVFLILSLID